MKKLILTTIATLGLCVSSPAVNNLLWVPTTALWDTTAFNWTDTATSTATNFTAGDNVLFDDTQSAFLQVSLIPSLSAGTVLVDTASEYTFTPNVTGGGLASLASLTKRGSGKLILDTDNTFTGPTVIEAGVLQIGNGSGRGTVGGSSISNASALVINRTGTSTLIGNLSGAGTLTNALGTFNIAGTNTMSGLISVNAGTLILSNAPAAGNSTEVQINATPGTAGTRLLLAGGVSFPAAATIKCLGTDSASNKRCNLLGNPGTNSLNGPILCSGNYAIQLNGSGVGEFVVAGAISVDPGDPNQFVGGQLLLRGTGVGKLSGTVNLPSSFVNKVDAGIWTISSTGNTWGSTAFNVGVLRVGADNALPTGLTLQMGQSSQTAILDLAGFNQQIAKLNTALGLSSSINIIANSSTTLDSVLTISAGGLYEGVIQDSISNGTRKVGLTITGTIAQQLSGNCTYSGPTTILAGGLSLVGSGSISNTPTIDISGPASLDAASRTDGTLWLGAGQTLKGNATFNIGGSLASQGTIELKVDKTGGTVSNDKVAVSGQVTYGGTLKLVLSGEALNSTDTLPIFAAGSYATSAFAAINPATPASGLVWDTSTLTTDGTLRIAAAATPPTIAAVALSPSGTDIILSGTGGVPNGGFSVVSSTNVADPLGTWTTVQTGSFDGSGNFSVTNAIVPGEPQRFYSLRVP